MWYFNKDNGNFSVGEIPMVEVDGEMVEQEGWELIQTRPEPHDDYVFDGEKWNKKEVVKIVPTQITPRQIRQQLTAIGLRETVEDSISSSDDYDLKDWWNHSQDFQRTHPILKEMGEKLGMSEEDMDSFFIEASKL